MVRDVRVLFLGERLKALCCAILLVFGRERGRGGAGCLVFVYTSHIYTSQGKLVEKCQYFAFNGQLLCYARIRLGGRNKVEEDPARCTGDR